MDVINLKLIESVGKYQVNSPDGTVIISSDNAVGVTVERAIFLLELAKMKIMTANCDLNSEE